MSVNSSSHRICVRYPPDMASVNWTYSSWLKKPFSSTSASCMEPVMYERSGQVAYTVPLDMTVSLSVPSLRWLVKKGIDLCRGTAMLLPPPSFTKMDDEESARDCVPVGKNNPIVAVARMRGTMHDLCLSCGRRCT